MIYLRYDIALRAMIYASRMKGTEILYHICNANISYGIAVYHMTKSYIIDLSMISLRVGWIKDDVDYV